MDPMIVEILRGSSVESHHLVDSVVLDASGKTVATYGDGQQLIYPRSSIKPLQALPFVLSGAYEKLSNPQKLIALSCASHQAEERHLKVLTQWQKELGLHDSDFACGPQPPDDAHTAAQLIRANQAPCRIHNNCSGKHLGFLSNCLEQGWTTQNYEKWDHPLQKEIRDYLTRFSGINHDTIPWGIDGCGIPTFFLPLESVARMMSIFLNPEKVGSDVADGLKIIRQACAVEPWMLAGEGSLCSEIGAITEGRVLAKVGAEGNYMALLFDQGLSVALKARDGSFRACEAALFALLEKYAGLSTDHLDRIRPYAVPPIRNWMGEQVGFIRLKI